MALIASRASSLLAVVPVYNERGSVALVPGYPAWYSSHYSLWPDVVDHFAFVRSLIERGQTPTEYPAATRRRWSTAEDDALRGSGMITDHQTSDSRTPWLAADLAAYHRLMTPTAPTRLTVAATRGRRDTVPCTASPWLRA
jgi:hypothetical protein